MSEGFRQALWRTKFPLTCPNQFLHVELDCHSQNKAGKGRGEEREEGMTKKGIWEVNVHLFLILILILWRRGLLLSQGRHFIFLWNKVPEVIEG